VPQISFRECSSRGSISRQMDVSHRAASSLVPDAGPDSMEDMKTYASR
jgi:hypothetical protein